MNYSYDPTCIATEGKDKMRFELGDTFVEGGSHACALSDEEYEAVINGSSKSWQHTKLVLLKAICMKLSYQVDEKIDVLSYGFSDRAKMWKQMCDELEKKLSATALPSISKKMLSDRPMFYKGLHDNQRV